MTPIQSFYAYHSGFAGGVRVAAGDVNGDGTPDIITGTGPGGGPHIRVFDGSLIQRTAIAVDIGGPVGSFYAFDSRFSGGVFVASGDFNQDNMSDIVVGAGAGGGPHVRILSGMNGIELAGRYVQTPDFAGGVMVAVTDLNRNGLLDLLSSAGAGGEARVRGFSGSNLNSVLLNRLAYPNFLGGVFLAGSLTLRISLAHKGDVGPSLDEVAASLNRSEIQPLIDEAIRRLEQAGLAPAGFLSDVSVQITDLEGNLLGLAIGNSILLDQDAAGFGWFIDRTPADDVEFQTGHPEVQGHFDLLTVITHELGHILGLTHHDEEPNFMSEHLTLSTRYRIDEDDLSGWIRSSPTVFSWNFLSKSPHRPDSKSFRMHKRKTAR